MSRHVATLELPSVNHVHPRKPPWSQKPNDIHAVLKKNKNHMIPRELEDDIDGWMDDDDDAMGIMGMVWCERERV